MTARPADQAVTMLTIREAAQRVVDAREANKRAFTQGGIVEKDLAVYEFEDAFADLRRVLALPDALTGSAPRLSAAQTHAIEDEVQKRGGRVVWGDGAPGAVETPNLDEYMEHMGPICEHHPDDCPDECDGQVAWKASSELAALKACTTSAERILTQATDVTELTPADINKRVMIQDGCACCGTTVALRDLDMSECGTILHCEKGHEIVVDYWSPDERAKFFGAASAQPSVEAVVDAVNAAYRQHHGFKNGQTFLAGLDRAIADSVLALLNPAPSTASASESGEK